MTMPVDSEEQEKEDEAIRQFLSSVQGLDQQRLDDLPGNLRAMFYGDDGTGKTVAGLALLNAIVPANKRIILIDTSQNALSISNHPKLKTLLPDGSPRLVRLPFRGESWLHALAATIRRGILPYDRVGGIQFDEYSSMADSFLGQILKVVEDKNPERPKDDATWPEYKMLLRKMKNLNSKFAALEGVHCVYIAHERTADKDPRNLQIVFKPNFTPSVGPEIRKPMHIIAHVTMDDAGRRKFQVHPDRNHLAKCKVGEIKSKEVEFKELADKTREWLMGAVPTVEERKPEPTVVPVTDEETMSNDFEGDFENV